MGKSNFFKKYKEAEMHDGFVKIVFGVVGVVFIACAIGLGVQAYIAYKVVTEPELVAKKAGSAAGTLYNAFEKARDKVDKK